MRSILRSRTPRRDANTHRLTHQAASWCLSYPDDAVLQRLALIEAAVTEQPADSPAHTLQPLIAHLRGTDPGALRLEYIDVFDLSRKHTLYLSYWTDGDTRRRGSVLGEFKQLYRDSGFLVDLNGELPDHLPIVLEFSALADPQRGVEVLNSYRASLELIRFSLLERGSPYASALSAVCATLPGPSPQDKAEAMALHTPAPTETVGLEPYDPRLLPLDPAR